VDFCLDLLVGIGFAPAVMDESSTQSTHFIVVAVFCLLKLNDFRISQEQCLVLLSVPMLVLGKHWTERGMRKWNEWV